MISVVVSFRFIVRPQRVVKVRSTQTRACEKQGSAGRCIRQRPAEVARRRSRLGEHASPLHEHLHCVGRMPLGIPRHEHGRGHDLHQHPEHEVHHLCHLPSDFPEVSPVNVTGFRSPQTHGKYRKTSPVRVTAPILLSVRGDSLAPALYVQAWAYIAQARRARIRYR